MRMYTEGPNGGELLGCSKYAEDCLIMNGQKKKNHYYKSVKPIAILSTNRNFCFSKRICWIHETKCKYNTFEICCKEVSPFMIVFWQIVIRSYLQSFIIVFICQLFFILYIFSVPCSKRKSHNQRQKLAAIQRTAKKLEAKINQKHPVSQGNRRGGGRWTSSCRCT